MFLLFIEHEKTYFKNYKKKNNKSIVMSFMYDDEIVRDFKRASLLDVSLLLYVLNFRNAFTTCGRLFLRRFFFFFANCFYSFHFHLDCCC